MVKHEGMWYANAYQGHSKAMGDALGPGFTPGEKLDITEYPYIYHGMRPADAGAIRRKGVLRGGVSGHRMHIHLTTGVRDRREKNGKPRQAVKGDAYVQIDAAELIKYHYEGHPVELLINEKGVILTTGAGGAQPDGQEWIRDDCIPAALCPDTAARFRHDGVFSPRCRYALHVVLGFQLAVNSTQRFCASSSLF